MSSRSSLSSSPKRAEDDDVASRPLLTNSVDRRPSTVVDDSGVSGILSFLFNRRPKPSASAHATWQSENRKLATRIERKLNARWTLSELVDSHLARLDAHYNGPANLPSRPADVAAVLMPAWKPPLEVAANWYGDWRPSALLNLVHVLSSHVDPTSSLFELSPEVHQNLTGAIRRFQGQEGLVDQAMALHQTNCVLRLPFGRHQGVVEHGDVAPVVAVAEEMRKVADGVIARAQKLRYRAVEFAVKKVLDLTQAAEFLVALTKIQELLHRHATEWKAHTGPLYVTIHTY